MSPPAILSKSSQHFLQDSIFCPFLDRGLNNDNFSGTHDLSSSKPPELSLPELACTQPNSFGRSSPTKHRGLRASPKQNVKEFPSVALPALNERRPEPILQHSMPPEPILQGETQMSWRCYLDSPAQFAVQTARSFHEDQRHRNKQKSPIKSARGAATDSREDHASGHGILSRTGIVAPEALPSVQPRNLVETQVAVWRDKDWGEEVERVQRFEMACFRRSHWEKAAQRGRQRRKKHGKTPAPPVTVTIDRASPEPFHEDLASSTEYQAAEAALKAKLSISRLDRLGGGFLGGSSGLKSLHAVPETSLPPSKEPERKGSNKKSPSSPPIRKFSRELVERAKGKDVEHTRGRRGSTPFLDVLHPDVQRQLLDRKNSKTTDNFMSYGSYAGRRASVMAGKNKNLNNGRALGRLRGSLLSNCKHAKSVEARMRNLQKLRRRSQLGNTTPEPMECDLKEEDRQRIIWTFHRYDADSSGTLDHAELRDALSDLGFQPMSREEKAEFANILGEADKEGDGELDIEEFEDLVGKVMKMLRQEQRRELYELFRLRDETETGALCMEEILAILADFSLQPRTDEEQKLVQQVIDEVDENRSGDLDFLEFELFIVHVRERLGCLRRERMRTITEDMGLSARLVKNFKSDLLDFWIGFDKQVKQGMSKEELKKMQKMSKEEEVQAANKAYLSHKQIQVLLTECGLGPKSKKSREETQGVIESVDKFKTDRVRFIQFLEISTQLRTLYSDRRRNELQALFKEFDKDGSGDLSFGEVSRMLEQMQVVPRTRMEQREIGLLFEAVDEDGSGELDFDEFQVLFQRIQEKLHSMQYKDEVETARNINISQAQMEEYRRAFEILDTKGCGELGLDSVRRMMDLLRIPISGDALNEIFTEVDEDESGLVEFKEFLRLMSLVEKHTQKFGRTMNRASGAFSRARAPSKDLEGS